MTSVNEEERRFYNDNAHEWHKEDDNGMFDSLKSYARLRAAYLTTILQRSKSVRQATRPSLRNLPPLLSFNLTSARESWQGVRRGQGHEAGGEESAEGPAGAGERVSRIPSGTLGGTTLGARSLGGIGSGMFRGRPLAELRILDIGAGGGFLSEELAKRGATVMAVDVSEATIAANQRRQEKIVRRHHRAIEEARLAKKARGHLRGGKARRPMWGRRNGRARSEGDDDRDEDAEGQGGRSEGKGHDLSERAGVKVEGEDAHWMEKIHYVCTTAEEMANAMRRYKANTKSWLPGLYNMAYFRPSLFPASLSSSLPSSLPSVLSIEGVKKGESLVGPNKKGLVDLSNEVQASKGFDVVVASEVIEHVEQPRKFLKDLDSLLRPGGVLYVTTPNRSWTSHVLTILVAERLLGLVPRGTHDWRRYIRYNELVAFMTRQRIPRPITVSIRSYLNWNWPVFAHGFGRQNGDGEKDELEDLRCKVRRALCAVRSGVSEIFKPQVESPLSPSFSLGGDDMLQTHYRLLSRTGSFYIPYLDLWFRWPIKNVLYMAAFRKERYANLP